MTRDRAQAAVFRTELTDPGATVALGERLAPNLSAGDTVLIAGPVGAGKSVLCRAIIASLLRAAGRLEDIPSPSYTLVQVYDDGDRSIWHSDLYRVSGPDEAIELGLDEAFEAAIVLVEWPERLGGLTPARHLWIDLSLGDAAADRRQLTLHAHGAWPWLGRCLSDLAGNPAR